MQQSGRRTVQVPADVERAVEESVLLHLRSELAACDLLLTADALRQAKAEATQRGKALLAEFITRCYGIQPQSSVAVLQQFQSEEVRAHVEGALAFGATSAIVLAPVKDVTKPDFKRIERLCAIFNLGIGLVDSLCDEDSGIGTSLISFLDGDMLMECAEAPRERGWLRTALPSIPAGVAAMAFAADLIEVFFQQLHAVYPGDRSLDLRRGIGRQLAAALVAERNSVFWSPDMVERERSLHSSRLTSVLPLQIIETLACGSLTTDERTAGTLLGEALWRVDDLVDLCQDVRSGALNSLLLRALDDAARSEKAHDAVTALEGLLASSDIAEASAKAAECLVAGLGLADALQPAQREGTRAFLYFIQSYAGVPPATGS